MNTRASRGTILAVGSDPAVSAAAAAAGSPSVPVSDAYEALARIARSGARDPVSAVVAAETAAVPLVVLEEAIRRLDPSVELRRVERTPETRDLVGEALDTAFARLAAGGSDDEPTGSREPSGEIGDIDLVAAVLAGDGRVVDLALGLVRRHLGSADVHLGAAGSAGPHDAVVEIRGSETTLGILRSASVAAGSLEVWARWLGPWLALERRVRELETQAMTDELTGAGNRRAFDRTLTAAIAEARHERRPLTLMVFDIDDFKRYNDAFGHDAGDEVLRETVALLRSVIRRGDHVFRVGGDEFVVIFADRRASGGGSPPESIEVLADRFRSGVARMRLPRLGLDAPGTVSISAGVATFPWDGLDGPTLLAHADRLALQSKRSGKNVITFGPGARDHCGES